MWSNTGFLSRGWLSETHTASLSDNQGQRQRFWDSMKCQSTLLFLWLDQWLSFRNFCGEGVLNQGTVMAVLFTSNHRTDHWWPLAPTAKTTSASFLSLPLSLTLPSARDLFSFALQAFVLTTCQLSESTTR
jgi:hypothetical protein